MLYAGAAGVLVNSYFQKQTRRKIQVVVTRDGVAGHGELDEGSEKLQASRYKR